MAIHKYQESEMKALHESMKHLPQKFHNLPFHEYIQQNTPIQALKAETEWLLWHQRLGHPSDYYLYNAYKYVKGIPWFKHETKVLDICPTCIRAKQVKEPAGPNSTWNATQPYQGLLVDFSFLGTCSKDPGRAKDYVGLNGETSWILITDHYSQKNHGATRISKTSI